MAESDQRISDEAHKEIASRLGVFPNFFLASSHPGLMDELWRFTKVSYLDLPLPSLFKERLFVYLSRFCEMRYCLIRHTGFLLGKGNPAGDAIIAPETIESVTELLSRPLPNATETSAALSNLEALADIQPIPQSCSEFEKHLFSALSVIFIDPRRAGRATNAVRHALGSKAFDMIISLLTYIRTAHYWTETHPNMAYEPDIAELLQQQPALANLMLDKKDSLVMSSNESLREALLDLAATQEHLQETQERFALAAQMAKIGTWDWDVRTGVLRWSELCSNIMGYEHKESDSIEKFNDCLHSYDKERVWQSVEKARDTHSLYNPEFRIIRRSDGTVIWVHCVGRFVYDEVTGEPVRMIGVIMDINERRQAEEALRESEEFKRRMIESSEDCIKVLDLEGNILSMNQRGAAILEIDDPNVYLHKNWVSFWDKKDQPRAYAAIQDAVRGKTGRFEGCLHSLKSQTPKWWSVIISPMMIGTQTTQLLAVSRDITEHKLHEQDLELATKRAEKANQTKSEFLANMSHEIRTPMNAVVGLANILSARSNIPPQEQQYLDTLKNSAQHLMNLINDMLDISKIESSKIELEKIIFSPSALTKECIGLITVEAEKKGLGINFHDSCGPDTNVMGDPLRTKQIIMNLLSNALKFTSSGSISVILKRDTHLQFIVEDTGIGMSPEVCTRIFDKFTQADASTTRKYGGTGLGLAISKQLAELMGGNITVKSQPGLGTQFTLTVPLERATGSTESSKPDILPDLPANTDKDLKILLVEDYDANILVAVTMLSTLGYICSVAKSGTEAMNRFRNERFDLILMDVQMPELDGYQTTAAIRDMEKAQNLSPTPIIAMTANALMGDKEKCLKAGMDDYVSKPFDFDDLQDKITRHTQSSAPPNELVA